VLVRKADLLQGYFPLVLPLAE